MYVLQRGKAAIHLAMGIDEIECLLRHGADVNANDEVYIKISIHIYKFTKTREYAYNTTHIRMFVRTCKSTQLHHIK